MNSCIVHEICEQVKQTAERISTLGCAIQSATAEKPDLAATFENQSIDELSHLQQLMLALTDMLLPTDANADEGSAFAEGELTDNIGDKTDYEAEKRTVTQ